jgi:uncharacterized protein YggL (DUF469 family)
MKTVIEMAIEAGFEFSGNELTWESVICTEELKRLVDLARADAIAAECESCAKYLNDQNTAITDKLAAEIRARSNT